MKKKLLYIGEPPTVHTGFGTVSKGILPALTKEFDVLLFSAGGYGTDCGKDLDKYGVQNYVPSPANNAHYLSGVDTALHEFDPDVVFIYYDTGSVHEYMEKTFISRLPVAAYLVTEGAPIMKPWQRLYNDFAFKGKYSKTFVEIEEPIVSSRFDAAEVLRTTGREVPVGYHGANHANFRQVPKDGRKLFRKALSKNLDTDLEDYFLIFYVARNADRKQWPRLFESLKLLKDQHPDFKFKLFAWTKKFDKFKEGGHYLPDIVIDKGLEESDVIFPQERLDIGGTEFDTDIDAPDPSLMKYYNMMDLYIHPSSGEACGLPALEAAKCGLPILMTEYSGGWEYVEKFAMPIKVQDFFTHTTGLKWALFDRQDLADKIYKFGTNKAMWHEYSHKSLKNCNYQWEALAAQCVAASHNAINNWKWSIR